MQLRYIRKSRRTGYIRFSSLDQNKMSDYWVYDLKSCRSYMIRLSKYYWILQENALGPKRGVSNYLCLDLLRNVNGPYPNRLRKKSVYADRYMRKLSA